MKDKTKNRGSKHTAPNRENEKVSPSSSRDWIASTSPFANTEQTLFALNSLDEQSIGIP